MKLLHRAAIILILLTTVVGLAISWTCPLYPNPCRACSGYVVSATGIKLCRNIYLGEDQEYYGCCEYQIQWLQCINGNPPGIFVSFLWTPRVAPVCDVVLRRFLLLWRRLQSGTWRMSL